MDNSNLSDIENLQNVYANTQYQLRESRKALLLHHAVQNESELLDKITSNLIPEHPAYEHYLSALIVGQMQAQIKAELMTLVGDESDLPVISLHMVLKDELEIRYASRLSEPVRLSQDALLLAFDTGLQIEVRYFDAFQYSIAWSFGEAEFRVDTAPSGRGLSHIHNATGACLPDNITTCGTECRKNFFGMLDNLLIDPLLSNLNQLTKESNS